MKRAVVIPFHRYPPFYKDHHKVLFTYWKRKFLEWHKHIHTLYFINSNNYLNPGEDIELKAKFPDVNFVFYNTENLSHGENLNLVLPNVVEDLICIMDMDTIVYSPQKLNEYFQELEFENLLQICAFVERENYSKISRFPPYFSIYKKNVLKGLEIDCREQPPIFNDPMSKLTYDLFDRRIAYEEVFDDRATIQLGKKEIMRNPTPYQPTTGIYHIRNFNGGIHLIDTFLTKRADFNNHFSKMPIEEVTRILAWNWVLNKYGLQKELIFQTIRDIVKLSHIEEKRWNTFITKFEQYHPYIVL